MITRIRWAEIDPKLPSVATTHHGLTRRDIAGSSDLLVVTDTAAQIAHPRNEASPHLHEGNVTRILTPGDPGERFAANLILSTIASDLHAEAAARQSPMHTSSAMELAGQSVVHRPQRPSTSRRRAWRDRATAQ